MIHELAEIFGPMMHSFTRRYRAVCTCGEEISFTNETRPRYVGDSKGIYTDAEAAIAAHAEEVLV